MGAHATVAPSSSHELANCSMSLLMRLMYPQRETTETDEGTAAHWVASETLTSYMPGNSPRSVHSFADKYAPNGILINGEITDSTIDYVNHALAVAQKYGCLRSFNIEQTIECKTVHPDSFGTPDLWFLAEHDGKYFLYIYDYKHGHLVVEAYMNWQLIHYLSGILDKLDILDADITVVMVVAQPRAYHRHGPIREWRVNAADCRPYINHLHNQAHEALGASPIAKSGNHCRNCAGRLSCEAFSKDVAASMQYASQNVPTQMEMKEIGIEKHLLEHAASMLKYRLSAIDTMIEHSGGCPGWKIEAGKGREKWLSEYTPDILKAIGVEMTEKPQTPKQAIASGVDEELVKSMSYRPTTDAKIVSDNQTLASRVFAKGN